MPTQITMPKLSDTMEEGTILRWFKAVGDVVEKGEVIAEVETDKADMELEAEAGGVIQELRVKEGEAAGVGSVLAVLGDGSGGASQERKETTADKAAPAAEGSAEAAPRTAPVAAKPTAAAKPVAAKPAATAAKPPAAPARPAPAAPESKPATPAATPAASAPPPPTARWKPRPSGAAALGGGRQEVSKLRQTVAKQMTASKRDTPHFYVTVEVDMSEAARLRATLAESGMIAERVTFTHLLIRALVLTLLRHPRLNASWADGAIVVHDDINIGIAVALDDGLVAPVLHRCQEMSLSQIAQATQDLVAKAKAGRFSGAEMTGATFSISNMGMLDIDEFSAVITPPQAAILSVGTIKERPVARAGRLAVAQTMRITISADHRVLNGVEAGRFLEDLKHILEHPALLLLN